MRVALYARVSTARDQHPEIQVDEMRKYCRARGWEVSFELVDEGYSGKSTKRPGLDRLRELVKTRKIDGVVTLKLDRLFRSLSDLMTTLNWFTECKVFFCAINDPIDMSTASGKLLIQVLGAFAEFERSLINERSALGMAAAKARGVKFGRPKMYDETKIIAARNSGMSYRKIERDLKIPMGVISRVLKGARLSGKIAASSSTP
jgi:DNA invertase Pin-like site-specific DNA recombinase